MLLDADTPPFDTEAPTAPPDPAAADAAERGEAAAPAGSRNVVVTVDDCTLIADDVSCGFNFPDSEATSPSPSSVSPSASTSSSLNRSVSSVSSVPVECPARRPRPPDDAAAAAALAELAPPPIIAASVDRNTDGEPSEGSLALLLNCCPAGPEKANAARGSRLSSGAAVAMAETATRCTSAAHSAEVNGGRTAARNAASSVCCSSFASGGVAEVRRFEEATAAAAVTKATVGAAAEEDPPATVAPDADSAAPTESHRSSPAAGGNNGFSALEVCVSAAGHPSLRHTVATRRAAPLRSHADGCSTSGAYRFTCPTAVVLLMRRPDTRVARAHRDAYTTGS